tara:strand:- start:554 stop:847 length:294 start_codon:yes stop_codon:yes gene_type:complete
MSELDEEIEAQIILKGEMFCRAEGIRWFCADDTFGCGAELPNIHYEEWMSRGVAIGIISAFCRHCTYNVELMNGRLEPMGSVKIWNSETDKLMPRRK